MYLYIQYTGGNTLTLLSNVFIYIIIVSVYTSSPYLESRIWDQEK